MGLAKLLTERRVGWPPRSWNNCVLTRASVRNCGAVRSLRCLSQFLATLCHGDCVVHGKRYTEAQFRAAERSAEQLGEAKGAIETRNEFYRTLGVNGAKLDELDELRKRFDYLEELYDDRDEREEDKRWTRNLRKGSRWASTKVAAYLFLAVVAGIGLALMSGARVVMLRWLGWLSQ